jgi:4-amino-4-deoxy-L-arabinose transferase-like glycosyltransferase
MGFSVATLSVVMILCYRVLFDVLNHSGGEPMGWRTEEQLKITLISILICVGHLAYLVVYQRRKKLLAFVCMLIVVQCFALVIPFGYAVLKWHANEFTWNQIEEMTRLGQDRHYINAADSINRMNEIVNAFWIEFPAKVMLIVFPLILLYDKLGPYLYKVIKKDFASS